MNRKPLLALLCLILFAATGRAQTWEHRYFTPEPSGHLLCYDYSNAYGGLIVTSLWNRGSDLAKSDYYLVRINPAGDTLWTKKNSLDGPFHAMINQIRQTANGGYLIATALGDTTIVSNDALGSKFYRLDSNGNILDTIHKGSDRTREQYVNIEVANNNGFY